MMMIHWRYQQELVWINSNKIESDFAIKVFKLNI